MGYNVRFDIKDSSKYFRTYKSADGAYITGYDTKEEMLEDLHDDGLLECDEYQDIYLIKGKVVKAVPVKIIETYDVED
jgi:hypothetical protein